MRKRSILVVAVDGLRASALGAYGNTIYPTPALDAFAADSLLLDFCYAPSADLNEMYRALWQSTHPARPQSPSFDSRSLPRILADQGYHTTLVTDDTAIHELAKAEFHRCVEVGDSQEGSATGAADEISSTALARIMAAAVKEISRADDAGPSLIWVHARGMYGPWDAPVALQYALLDDDDPPPIEMNESPELTLSDANDPDTAFRYGCAYAAQVMLLDTFWAGLMEAVDEADANREWIVMLVGVRGFPLGEHRQIGGVDSRLYSEQLHVPWLLRLGNDEARLARSGQLTTPLDLLPTLLESIGAPARDDAAQFDGRSIWPLAIGPQVSWREGLVSCNGEGGSAIRSESWCLRRDGGNNGGGELFVRPDDRWEANDVAKLCPEVVEQLSQAADQSIEKLSGKTPASS